MSELGLNDEGVIGFGCYFYKCNPTYPYIQKILIQTTGNKYQLISTFTLNIITLNESEKSLKRFT